MAQKKYLHFDGVSEEAPKDKDGNYEIKAKSKKINHDGSLIGLLGVTLCC